MAFKSKYTGLQIEEILDSVSNKIDREELPNICPEEVFALSMELLNKGTIENIVEPILCSHETFLDGEKIVISAKTIEEYYNCSYSEFKERLTKCKAIVLGSATMGLVKEGNLIYAYAGGSDNDTSKIYYYFVCNNVEIVLQLERSKINDLYIAQNLHPEEVFVFPEELFEIARHEEVEADGNNYVQVIDRFISKEQVESYYGCPYSEVYDKVSKAKMLSYMYGSSSLMPTTAADGTDSFFAAFTTSAGTLSIELHFGIFKEEVDGYVFYVREWLPRLQQSTVFEELEKKVNKNELATPDWNAETDEPGYIKNRTHFFEWYAKPEDENFNDLLLGLKDKTPISVTKDGHIKTVKYLADECYPMWERDFEYFDPFWKANSEDILDGFITVPDILGGNASPKIFISNENDDNYNELIYVTIQWNTEDTTDDVNEVIRLICSYYYIIPYHNYDIWTLNSQYIPSNIARTADLVSINQKIETIENTPKYFGPILEGHSGEDIVWDRSTGKATIDMNALGLTHIVYPTFTPENDVFYKVVSLAELRTNPRLDLEANKFGAHGTVYYSESNGIITLTLTGTHKIYDYPWKAVVHINGVVPLSEAFLPESAVKKSDLKEYVKRTELGDFEAEVVDVKLTEKQDKPFVIDIDKLGEPIEEEDYAMTFTRTQVESALGMTIAEILDILEQKELEVTMDGVNFGNSSYCYIEGSKEEGTRARIYYYIAVPDVAYIATVFEDRADDIALMFHFHDNGYEVREAIAELKSKDTQTEAKLTELSEKIENLPSGESSVFAAVWGETSYEELKAAFESRKICTCVYNNVMYNAISLLANGEIQFVATTLTSHFRLSCISSGVWSTPTAYEVEKASNKVTTLSASSTNLQYPSAKAVYDALQNVGGGSDVFEAEYGVTTYDEIVEAYNERKVVFVKKENFSYYLNRIIADTGAYFFAAYQAVHRSVVCSFNNAWSEGTINMGVSIVDNGDGTLSLTANNQTAEVATPQYVENLLGTIINGDY